jgi:hypothetical protein
LTGPRHHRHSGVESSTFINAPALPKQPGAGNGGSSSDATPTVSALGHAAQLLRQAMRDKTYRSTPLGLEVGRYCRWKRNEWGATTETMRDYEAILVKLALDHADLELSDFCPACRHRAAPGVHRQPLGRADGPHAGQGDLCTA